MAGPDKTILVSLGENRSSPHDKEAVNTDGQRWPGVVAI